MSTISIKKILLAGTALVAVAFISAPVSAAVVNATLDGTPADNTWAELSNGAGTQSGLASEADANDTVSLATHTLLITNDQTANDGSANKNTFVLGTINNNVNGAGGVTVLQSANAVGAVVPFAVTIAGVTNSALGASTMSVTSVDGANQSVTVGVGAGGLTLGGALAVTNGDSTASLNKTVALTVAGDTAVTGTTRLVAGADAGEAVSVTNTDIATYTGAVTLTAGPAAGANATLTLNGSDGGGVSAFTGGLVLNDGTAGLAELNVGGGAVGVGVQTINGTINGGANGEGTLVSANNFSLVTFGSAIGTGTTALKAVTLTGTGGTTFDTTVQAATVTINSGAGLDTFTGAVTGNMVYGVAGGTALLSAGLAGSADFAGNAGTLELANGQSITGAVNNSVAGGANVLTLQGTSTVGGAVGASNAVATVNAGATTFTSTFNGDVNATTLALSGSGTVDLNGTGTNTIGAIAFAGNAGIVNLAAGVNLTGTVTAANTGTLTLAGSSSISGAVGGAGAVVGTINAGIGTDNFASTVNATTVNITGTSTVTFTGLVTSNVDFGAAGAVVLTGGLAGNVDFAGNGGTVTVGTGKGISLNVDNSVAGGTNTLTLSGGAQTIGGTVGLTNAVDIVNAGATAATSTFTGAVNATTMNFTGTGAIDLNGTGTNTIGTIAFGANGGTLALANNVNLTLSPTGGITATNTGTVTLAGASAITGTIGASGDVISTINAGAGLATVSGDVYATALDFNGTNTVELNGTGTNAVTTVAFGGNDGTLSLGAGANLTGAVTTTGNDLGTVTLVGASTISGTLGGVGKEIKVLNAGAESTASTVSGAVYAGTVAIAGGADAANPGSMGFGSTLNVGAGGMTVTSGGVGTLQNESATVTGTFTDAATLGVVAAATGNATLTLNGSTTANVITDAATLTDGAAGLSTLEMGTGASVTFTAGLNGSAPGKGTLTLDGGTQTVTGTVGATDGLLAIGAGKTGGATTFMNTVDAVTINVGSGSVKFDDDVGNITTPTSLTFNTAGGTAEVAAGKTLTGAIIGATGTTTTGIGSITFDGASSGITTIGVGGVLNALTLTGSTTVSTTGNVTAANTMNLGTGTLAVGGAFTAAAGQTITSTLSGSSTVPVYGNITSTGAATVNTATLVNLTISPTIIFPVGSVSYNIVGGTVGAGVAALGPNTLKINGVTDTEALATTPFTEGVMTYTQTGAAGPALTIEVTRATTVSVATTANNQSVATALGIIGETGNTALNNVQGAIAAAPTAAAVNNILGTLSPTVDGGAQMVALDVGTQVEGITETRMAALRADDGTTGVAAGAGANGTSMWIQGYGQGATQDERQDIAGYTASTFGGAVGVDSEEIINNGVLGFALNYGHADVNSKNLNTTHTGVDDYGFTLYDTIGLDQQMFVDTQAGFAYNKIASIRHNVGAGGLDADGSTHSDQYNAKALLGQDYDVDYGTILTPDVSLAYTRLNTQGYTETGTAADLTVASNSQNNLDLGIGAKIAWKLKDPDGSLMKPVLHAGYSYAVVDDRIDTTANFTGADPAENPSFVTEGPSPERSRFDVGAGLTYMTTANWDLSANYNFEYRTDYASNTGTLRMTAHF